MHHGGGRTGILFPVGDVPALAQALGRVLLDPAERERLRQAAPGRAAVYDVANWARQWGELLVQLHEEKSMRAGKTLAPGPRSCRAAPLIARHMVGMTRLGTTCRHRETAPLCVESNRPALDTMPACGGTREET